MRLNSGFKLGPYEIVSLLGAGGMGEVYRARDARLDRTVAIKILPEASSGGPERRLRFEREARAVAALSHPHICAVYDVGQQDEIHYIVMEYLQGETLAARLLEGAFPLDQAVHLGAEIAEALDQAHRHGIVHRDLKPGNVMLTPAGAKLLDFGLAKPAMRFAMQDATGGGLTPSDDPTRTAALTIEGSILGSIGYMAPEQLEGKEVDARSDIFSLGCVIYEMISGQQPFSGLTPASVLGAILRAEPEALINHSPTVPLSLDRAVRRCLAKNPEERWQSARDLSLELRWIADHPVTTEEPASQC